MQRRFGTLLALASTFGVVALTPQIAAADPTAPPVTACSAWNTINGYFKVQACVQIDYSSTSVQHYGYLKYIGSGTSPKINFSVQWIVNGGGGLCPGGLANVALSRGQVRESSCFTAQDVGSTYWSQADLDIGNNGSLTTSPKLKDTH